MDLATKKMFVEKNDQIFNNKVLIDIDNNIDSLKITINNYVIIASSKLLKKITSLLNDNNNEYTMSDVNELINELKTDITNKINDLIDEKKEKVKKNISLEKGIDLSTFHSTIDESTKELDIKLHSESAKKVYVDFSNKFMSIVTLSNDDEKETFLLILNRYDNNLHNNVMDAVKLRDNNLKNISNDSKEKVDAMTEIVTNKTKVKSE